MEVANPTITEALAEFLSEQEKRLAPSTTRKYRYVVDLLTHSIDGYAHQTLNDVERAFWEKRWEADEEAGSFSNTFGPERILENIGEFLGYFMVRKVFASKDLLRAAGTVTKALAKWLEGKGYAAPDEAADAIERGTAAAHELPRAEELGSLLYDLRDHAPPARIIEEWDDPYAMIARVEPGKIWFHGEKGREIGPIVVPKRASELAQPGWAISALLLGQTRSGWRILEIGNVYP